MAAHIYNAAIKQLAAELLFICYRCRRDHGATAGALADEYKNVAELEARYQVLKASEQAQRDARLEEALYWQAVDGANAYAEERE